MIRGLYSAAAGLIANERQQEVVANDITNMTTPGFKEDDASLRSFPEQLVYSFGYGNGKLDGASGSGQAIGALGTGVYVDEVLARLSEGALTQTQKPYDFAVVDSPASDTDYARAYFTVQDGAGNVSLSRDGSFHLDANNDLTTSDGRLIVGVGANGAPLSGTAIRVNPNYTGSALFDAAGQPLVDVNGNSSFEVVNVASGQPVGGGARFGVAEVADARKLTRNGADTFSLGTTTYTNLRASVQRGSLEQSNVDPTRAMVSLDAVLRSYEANQKVIQTMDSTLGKAVNDVGKVG